MKKFTHLQKINEREETLSNIPQPIGVQTDTVVVTTSVESQPLGETQSQVPPTEEAPKEEVKEVNADQPKESQPVTALFSKMFESKEMAHIYHLQVNGQQGSHASHVALNDYYINVLDLIDMLIEIYSAQYGIVDSYETIDTNTTRSKDPIAYFEEVVEFIKHSRNSISIEDTHLHSIIDDVVCLLYRTLYKLKFTK